MAATKPQLSSFTMRHAVTVVAAAVVGCGGASDSGARTAAPAEVRAAVPADVERYVHETFHRLPRSCARGRADRQRLDATTATFIELYRSYPSDRFGMTIDDEAGTMLSAILVLRDELARCSPRHAALIDAVLPASVRRALRPLRAAGR